ncbi:MauE/DoxX family redox-associated membrane protein [Flavobacterium sp. ZS1P70]|uniref:MauE/DoxX family redox-associated membrane protein n=1 Tax=Flavobacterium zhoui TaxID=3230414 RepID=A0ABW6I7C6_9FLAO
MKLTATSKSIFINSICLLYILLFVYAAVSKLLDFENFRVQLGQSPLLNIFASWLAWLVPLIELVIAIALCFYSIRFWALYAGFILMTMFTAYIYIILNYSSYVPCSCGGILEKLGWTEHLVFNLGFLLLAISGLFLLKDSSTRNNVFNKN